MTDSMKDKIRLAISKAGQKKDFKTIDMLEKMISGSLPINYSLIDKIINEEVSDPSEQIRNQQEIIRDLRDRISQTENNDEKQSLQLKLNVAQAKLEELQNRQSTQNASEEAPYQKLRFLDTDNNGNTIQDEKIEESVYVLRDYNTRRFLSASGRPTDIKGAQRYYSKEQAQCSAKALKSRGIYAELDKLDEGCMTKKLEDMDNRQLAKYIFNHPNTKFADKIKECDVAELMKAIKELKKDEDAPVTNTAAVATVDMPLMYTKRKLNESVDSEISEILDEVEDLYGMKARKLVKNTVYHNKWDMTPNSFLYCANKLADKGYLDDFILSILENDSVEYQRLIKKC